MYKSVKKSNAIQRYMELLEIHNGAMTVHFKDIKSCIYVVEAKKGTLRVKHIDITVCFSSRKKLKMVSLFQNKRIIVSYQIICIPNHVQFQLSVGAINGCFRSL